MSIITSEEKKLLKNMKTNERTKKYYSLYPEKRQKSTKEYLKTYMRHYMTEIYNPKKMELSNVEHDNIELIDAINNKYKEKLRELKIKDLCKNQTN